MAKKQKKPYLINKPKTAKQMLRILDTFLAENNHPFRRGAEKSEAAKLWDVLSATRGPDSESSHVKEHNTCPIRRAAFPKTAENDGDVPASFSNFDFYPTAYQDINSHFNEHVAEAAKVLGLERGQRVYIRNGKVVKS